MFHQDSTTLSQFPSEGLSLIEMLILSNFTDFGITNHFLKTQVHLMKAIFVARSAGSSLFCLPEPCLRRQTGHTELQSLLPFSLVEVTGESGADVLVKQKVGYEPILLQHV